MDCSTRLEKLQTQLDELQLDAFLVSDETNVRYLTGFTGESTQVLVQADRVTLLSDGRYQTQLAKECRGVDFAIRPPHQSLHHLVLEVVGSAKVKRLALEASAMSLAEFLQLEEVFREAKRDIDFEKTCGVIEAFREIKDTHEIETIRKAIEIAEEAFLQTTANLSPDHTEIDVANQLEWGMRKSGAEGVSFDIIAAFGEMAALPHYHPAERKLGCQPTVLIDWGARVDGYVSDITRTLYRVPASGKSCSIDRYESCYQAVLEAQFAAIDALKPGVTGREVDCVAREVLDRHGLGEAFLHSLGHGIGLQVHEGPRLASAGEKPLQPGMVVTVEPGVYFAGDFGIRIEDDVLITPEGAEVLTTLPKGLDDCRWML